MEEGRAMILISHMLLAHESIVLSFRYIGDTMGYDRSRHVSEVIKGLWVDYPRGRVYPVPGSPGDDLPGCRQAP